MPNRTESQAPTAVISRSRPWSLASLVSVAALGVVSASGLIARLALGEVTPFSLIACMLVCPVLGIGSVSLAVVGLIRGERAGAAVALAAGAVACVPSIAFGLLLFV